VTKTSQGSLTPPAESTKANSGADIKATLGRWISSLPSHEEGSMNLSCLPAQVDGNTKLVALGQTTTQGVFGKRDGGRAATSACPSQSQSWGHSLENFGPGGKNLPPPYSGELFLRQRGARARTGEEGVSRPAQGKAALLKIAAGHHEPSTLPFGGKQG